MTESEEVRTDAGAATDTKWLGVGLALVLHVVGIPLVAVGARIFGAPDSLGDILFITALNFGLAQLFYMPLGLIWLTVKKRPRARLGMLIVFAVGLVITGGCWALVSSSL